MCDALNYQKPFYVSSILLKLFNILRIARQVDV